MRSVCLLLYLRALHGISPVSDHQNHGNKLAELEHTLGVCRDTNSEYNMQWHSCTKNAHVT